MDTEPKSLYSIALRSIGIAEFPRLWQTVQVKNLVLCFIISLLLSSCVSTETGQSYGTRVSSSPSLGCEVPEGWAEVGALEPKYVVFGELHGTREGPGFVSETLCRLAEQGERLLLAVEHSASENDKLQAVWLLSTEEFKRALPSTGWVGRKDGVASEAMFELMARAHELKELGFPIDVVAFNGGRDAAQRAKWAHLPSQGPHEAAQAENIYTAGSAEAYDRVLVLVGNYHARKQPIDIGAGEFEPMAMRLAKLDKTVSLNMRYADGFAWNCLLRPEAEVEPGMPIPEEAIDCNNHPTSGYPDLKRSPFIQLDPVPSDRTSSDYDGFFWVGAISGSQPIAE